MNKKFSEEELIEKSCPYVLAPKGIWINADRKELDMYDPKETSIDYLNKCILMMERLEDSAKDYSNQFNKVNLVELYQGKLNELKEAVVKRTI